MCRRKSQNNTKTTVLLRVPTVIDCSRNAHAHLLPRTSCPRSRIRRTLSSMPRDIVAGKYNLRRYTSLLCAFVARQAPQRTGPSQRSWIDGCSGLGSRKDRVGVPWKKLCITLQITTVVYLWVYTSSFTDTLPIALYCNNTCIAFIFQSTCVVQDSCRVFFGM